MLGSYGNSLYLCRHLINRIDKDVLKQNRQKGGIYPTYFGGTYNKNNRIPLFRWYITRLINWWYTYENRRNIQRMEVSFPPA